MCTFVHALVTRPIRGGVQTMKTSSKGKTVCRGLRINQLLIGPGNPGADALQETVVPELPARDGLIIGISGWFRDTGQQSLDERIDEREKSLLPQLDGADLAGQAVETRGNPCFRRVNTALTTRQLPFDGRPHERGRTGEATIRSGALDAPEP